MVLSALLLSLFPADAKAEVVNVCGAVVLEGVLAGDLDCSGAAHGVLLLEGGTLDLAGHTLHSGSEAGVLCSSDCSVDGGGGRITGGGQDGIRQVGGDVLRVRDVEISGHARSGIELQGRRLVLVGSTISGNDAAGVHGGTGTRVLATDSTISSNGYGVTTAGSARVKGCDVADNLLTGVWAAGKATILSSSVDGNGGGVYSTRLVAKDSVLSANDVSVVCELEPSSCFDAASVLKPRLPSSSCGRSLKLHEVSLYPLSESWEACSLD